MIADYLKNLTKVLGVGAGFASIPLFVSIADLQPPWPPAVGYVSAGLVMLASLMAWEWTRKARLSTRRALILWTAFGTVGGLVGYLILYSMFIEEIPQMNVRVIRGYACSPEAAIVYGDSCLDLPRDALKGAEWEASALWTRQSITVVRISLLLMWLLFTSGLIAAVGSIIAGRRFSNKA